MYIHTNLKFKTVLVFGIDIAILQAMETLDLETILKRTCVVVQVVQYTVFSFHNMCSLFLINILSIQTHMLSIFSGLRISKTVFL